MPAGVTLSLADDEQGALVLRVNTPVWSDRQWCVRGAEREIEKDLRFEQSALVDGVEISVLAVCVDHAMSVDHRSVDAPFEADIRPLRAGGVRNTGDGAVGVGRAALAVRALELPLDAQVWIELRDEERSVLPRRADAVDVAIRAELWTAAVFVVLDHHRIRPAVTIDRRRRIPSEAVRTKKIARRTESHQMTAREVIARVGAVENGAVRCDGDRRRGIIENPASGPRILGRVDARCRSEAASAGRSVGRKQGAGKRPLIVVAAVVQSIAQRRPPSRGQIGM